MTVPRIAVVNQSSVLADTQATILAQALQHQASYDWAPIYASGATVRFFPAASVPANWWQLVLLDDSDQAGALGYHDLTSTGQPLGKVFARSDQEYGYNPTVTASHEFLEMLGDPWIDRCVQVGSRTFYAYEVADACEADQYGYPVTVAGQSVQVSDFVYPTWFDGGPGPYDHAGHVTSARQLLPGGYIGAWTPTTGWTQKTHPDGAPASRRIELRRRKHAGETLTRSTV